MKIRLGYVAISNKLGKKITSSSTITYKNYEKIIVERERGEKLKKVTLSNLNDLIKILKYNHENDVHFYRITSKLIPLITHPNVGDWGYKEIFKKDFEYIGKIIKEFDMRVDTHPDQFNVINSSNPEVVQNTIKNLITHVDLFEMINYPEGKMVLHIGGATGGKEIALERFKDNFYNMPKAIKEKIILENDDKIYTLKETLTLCENLNIPMVLDVHHHNCNNNGEVIKDYLPRVFNTWKDEKLPPKLHFSSPREGELDRKHADYIDPYKFIEFIELSKSLNKDYDMMLECKEKDIALYQLVKDIKKIKPEYTWEDQTTLLIN